MRSKQRSKSWWLSRRRSRPLVKRRRNLSLTTGAGRPTRGTSVPWAGAAPVSEDGERALADEESTLHGPFPRRVGIAEKWGDTAHHSARVARFFLYVCGCVVRSRKEWATHKGFLS